MKLLKFIFQDKSYTAQTLSILAVSLFTGIGMIINDVIGFGIAVIVIINGVYLIGCYRNMNGKQM